MLSLTSPFSDGRAAYSYQGIGPRWADAAVIGFWLVAALALGGLALGAFRRAPAWFWLTPPLLFVSVIWISGDTRYRLPIEPFLVCAAAVAVVAAGDALSRRRSRPRRPTPAQPR
jgi:hypothetical protein